MFKNKSIFLICIISLILTGCARYQTRRAVLRPSSLDFYDSIKPKGEELQKSAWLTGEINRVVIDPGHGGKDPGAVSKYGLKEKDITLDIAKRLRNKLAKQGISVVLTRTTDKFVSLWRRSNIANTSNADLFVSIHVNSSRYRQAYGFESYYLSTAINDNARALETAKKVSTGLAKRAAGLNTEAILWDIIYTYNRAKAAKLADSISRSMGSIVGARNRGTKQARYYVLKNVRIPSVLIEVGFISNGNEAVKLQDKYYKNKIALAISKGILNYK